MALLRGVYCKYCDQAATRLMLFAMMQDAGAQTSNDAVRCWAREDGGEHDFVERVRVASADTHPKDGDASSAAPLVSGDAQ